MTTVAPDQVEAPQKGFAGTSIPRKEDKRLVQGEGVFFDDVKRHGMGYVHFVRSPYAHAGIVSIDVSAAEAVEGVYGTLIGEEVAAQTDPFFEMSTPPGSEIRDYALAVGKVRFAGEPVAAVVAETRELARDAAELVEVEYEPLEPVLDAVDSSRARRADPPRRGRLERRLVGDLRVGRLRRGAGRGRPRRQDRPPLLPPLLLDAPRMRRRARRVRQGHRPVDAALQPPDAGDRDRLDGPGAARRHRQAPHRHAGHRRRLRQQDHAAPVLRRPLPARAEAQPPGAVDGVAHGPAHGEHARQRAHVPRRRGAGEGRRHDARLQGQGVRRRRRLPALRAARLHHLGAGDARAATAGATCASTSRRPARTSRRRLRTAATRACSSSGSPSASSTSSRTSSTSTRSRSASATTSRPRRCPTRRPTAASTTRATTRGASTSRSTSSATTRSRSGARTPSRAGSCSALGIGSTLDSGTNNFGQSQLLNPELQFSGNNEVATVRLDIFGEVVVTLGTTPQGQSHETTSAQVVADILGITPDDVHVRAGHDSYWNSHAGFSGTYASQFAVTGLEAVKGATLELHSQIRRLAAVILGADGPDDIVLEEGMAKRQGHAGGRAAVHGLRRDHQREQRRPSAGARRRHPQLPLRLPAAVPGAGPRDGSSGT